MARLSVIVRNEKRKKIVAHYAIKRAALKAAGDTEGLDKLPRDSSPIRVRNRCAITGRPRAYSRKFGLCRNMVREMAHKGQLPGLRKASW